LRVEGAGQTLYDGSVTAAPGLLDGDDGTGAHPCLGDQPATPQATAAGALSGTGLAWQGTWFPEFGDFFVDRIGPDVSQAPFAYWALLVNWRYAGGACQSAVRDGDEVLWAYDTAQRPLILRLRGPTHVAQGAQFTVAVRDGWVRADGSDGGPVAGASIAGASVAGAPSGGDGQAPLQIDQPGLYWLRATRSDAISSNSIAVCVGDLACQSQAGPPAGTGGSSPAAAPPSLSQSPPTKGANHETAHRSARRCIGSKRTDRRHTGARRHTGHRLGSRRGRDVDTLAAHDGDHDHHGNAPARKLSRHECRRRTAARYRGKLGPRRIHTDDSRRDP
jgi:hypothetical protein